MSSGDLIGLGEAEPGAGLDGVDGLGFEGAPQAGIDGEGGGDGEGFGARQLALAEEVEERGLVLVDGGEAGLDFGQRAGEKNFEDALLLVAEERAE